VDDYARMERAIRYLEANRRAQPTLEDVAAHVGLSPYHFQRVFSRWAGVSPKRFLQYLTAEHAKRLLRESETVLDATYEAGLSGPARLHDLMVAVEAMTPGEVGARGRGLEIRWGVHPSPFGQCLIGATERGVCWLSFEGEGSDGDPAGDDRARGSDPVRDGTAGNGHGHGHGHGAGEVAAPALAREWPAAVLVKDPAATGRVLRKVFAAPDWEAVRAGDDAGASSSSDPRPLPLLLSGTNFQIRVWEALLRIPAGVVRSYGDVARSLGRPEATRAVGSAIGANRISYLIPCHRVIRGTGTLGGYRWGASRKRAMLAWEAARSAARESA
jgi:AraC family transcriptional regulator of adaptative response/methylated-DNA-[protein]-cysteine methyltransferase